MRRPRKAPALKTWESPHYRIELHKQQVGYVLWAFDKFEGQWEWGAYKEHEDAEREAAEHYGVRK